MKKIILLIVLAMGGALSSWAEEISYVETSGRSVYIYNAKGRNYKTLSYSTVGIVKGFSSRFFVSESENGTSIYLWDADGKKYKTLSKSTVGNVIGVAGDTFTSRKGSTIYTWDKNGKKISSRSAN